MQQKGIYTEYLIIGKETLSPKISLLSPFHSFYGFIRTFSSLHTPVVFLFLYNFAREIGAWPAKTDSVAHARCLTVVLSYSQREWRLDTSIARFH